MLLRYFITCMVAAVSNDFISSLSDDEEILLIILLLRRRRSRLKAANRLIWTKRWISRRQTKGVCLNTIRELDIEDPEKYRQYHWLDRVSFEDFLNEVSPFIQRQDTVMRDSLKPRERLHVRYGFWLQVFRKFDLFVIRIIRVILTFRKFDLIPKVSFFVLFYYIGETFTSLSFQYRIEEGPFLVLLKKPAKYCI